MRRQRQKGGHIAVRSRNFPRTGDRRSHHGDRRLKQGGHSVKARNVTSRLIGLAAVGLVSAGVIAGTASAASNPPWKIGVSNTLQGNGWREQMICAVKAQSKVSGKVSSVSVESQTTNAAGQIAQIRRLISQGVNAIIINPADPKALDGVIAQAAAEGHRGGRPSTSPSPPRRPTRPTTTRWPTGAWARSGCSSSSAARATWSRCAASPAPRPTRTATRASSRP